MAEIILPPEENEETPQAPELNIDKPTENSKVITIEFEAKKTNKVSTKDTNQQLYTTDTDAWFEFKETSLENANGTYSVVFRNRHDGSIFQRTGDVVGGVAYYKIPHQEIRHAGKWRGQVVYTLSNGDTTAREFDYDVKGHILDGKDVREIVVEDFETLMSQLRSMKDNAEVELANLTQELRNTTDTAEQNETDRQAFFDDLVGDIDELQANYQELLDTGVLQTNINTKLEALEEEYAPKLTEVTAQLAQTDEEVSEIRNKKVGNGVLAEMGDLSQQVKESMSGGSVAVVGEGAVAKVNLANDLKTKVEEIDDKENIVISRKNMFNPDELIHGEGYGDYGQKGFNSTRKVTPKYPVAPGDEISLSGIDGINGATWNFTHLWGGEDGSVFIDALPHPTFPTTDFFTFVVPEEVTFFSINISSGVIPEKMQIEKSPKPTAYEPYKIPEHSIAKGTFEGDFFNRSGKNLYDGKVAFSHRSLRNGVYVSGQHDDGTTSFIPVEYGKYYTISGMNPEVLNIFPSILGYSDNKKMGPENFVKEFQFPSDTVTTIFIDDPSIKYIIFAASAKGVTNQEDALNNRIQVEEGTEATPYEPYEYIPSLQKAIYSTESSFISKLNNIQQNLITDFIPLNKVRTNASNLSDIVKDISPFGISNSVVGDTSIDSESNNLYGFYQPMSEGKKELNIYLANRVDGSIKKADFEPTPFAVPSGQFDNEGTIQDWNREYSKDDYTHPQIAYDPQGVAGYKYWMIASILTARGSGDAVWEDEDLFVSNNAKDWLRVKSLYEDDKSYTTQDLRLPPHSLATNNARKHAFLPVPALGDSIEISVPADNGAPEVNRKQITISELAWKHDPAIFIDNGYVYTYHSFHLPYIDRDKGSNRFIVCVRTNNGIDWEIVRTDGSTMALTEQSSRKIFTKDDQGRYNYMKYVYKQNYSNPKILKYGEGDYELVYGNNFSFRVKGTTPYNFDFSTQYPFHDVGSGNHPGLLLDGGDLYLLNNESLYISTDRGESFTRYEKYPGWIGGLAGYGYKKTLTKGDGGKVILVEVQRQILPASTMPAVNNFGYTNAARQMYIYEYESVFDFVSKAENGIIDGYIDLQVTKVNYSKGKRNSRFYPYISNNKSGSTNNFPMQRIKVADIEVEEGDIIHLYVTLNSRNGAKIDFGGIEIV